MVVTRMALTNPESKVSFAFDVVRDRLHFFIAPEFDHATAPTPGPFVGQAVGASPAMPVSIDDVTRFGALLRDKGLDPGDGGRVMSFNPGVTLFARLDIALPEWQSRVVLRDNYTAADATRFARPEGVPGFPLSSNAWTQRTTKHTSAVQVFTQVRASAFNEFVLSYMDWPLLARGYNRSPSIQAAVPSAIGVAPAALNAGPPATGTGKDGRPREVYLYHVVDNAWSMAEYGSQAVVWQTAVNPVVALELIDSGAWSGAGVLGPEALPPRPFLDLLTDYGSPWACEERTPA